MGFQLIFFSGIWLDHYSKMKVRTAIGNGLSGFMLLASVALGVCFILTAVMICHYWNSNTTGYQPVQKIAKRARSLRRRLSRAKSCDKKDARPPTSNPEDKGYHIVWFFLFFFLNSNSICCSKRVNSIISIHSVCLKEINKFWNYTFILHIWRH